jgi:hypothetical protein
MSCSHVSGEDLVGRHHFDFIVGLCDRQVIAVGTTARQDSSADFFAPTKTSTHLSSFYLALKKEPKDDAISSQSIQSS